MGALAHDHAVAIAAAVIEVFAPLLREEEQRTAFDEVYLRVKAGIEHYETRAGRMHERLHPVPSEN